MQSTKGLKAATHGQPNHLDEMVAICLLKAAYDIDQVDFLSRDEITPEKLDEYDFVVDIGGEYDPERGRFDHHQGNDPRVVNKSAAGLVFDFLVSEGKITEDEADYLRPVIKLVDMTDNGLIKPDPNDPLRRAYTLLSVSSFIKSITGMRHNPDKDREFADMFQNVVDKWIEFAQQWGKCKKEIDEEGIVVGRAVLLTSAENYGPPMLEYLSEKTIFELVGFQAEPSKFILRVVEEPDGTKRITLNKDMLPQAQFVHRNGFMAVYRNMSQAIEDIRQIYK